MVGFAMGQLIFGAVSHRFGRKEERPVVTWNPAGGCAPDRVCR
jgi:hypothetical protein